MTLEKLTYGFAMGRRFLASDRENELAISNGKLSSVEEIEQYWLEIDSRSTVEKVGFVVGMATRAPVDIAVGLYEMIRGDYLSK